MSDYENGNWAVLVLSTGRTVMIEGTFAVLCETTGGTLSSMDWYRDGEHAGGLVCSDFKGAVRELGKGPPASTEGDGDE